MCRYKPAPEDQILKAFQTLDTEGKGYLTNEELTKWMTEEGTLKASLCQTDTVFIVTANLNLLVSNVIVGTKNILIRFFFNISTSKKKYKTASYVMYIPQHYQCIRDLIYISIIVISLITLGY